MNKVITISREFGSGGKSIMSSVAINAADNLELVISGPDEKQAAETINNLFCS